MTDVKMLVMRLSLLPFVWARVYYTLRCLLCELHTLRFITPLKIVFNLLEILVFFLFIFLTWGIIAAVRSVPANDFLNITLNNIQYHKTE